VIIRCHGWEKIIGQSNTNHGLLPLNQRLLVLTFKNSRVCFIVRNAFTLVEMLCVIVIIMLLMAISLPAIHRVRLAADRLRCSNQLRQLSLALIRCHEERGALPMGVTPNEIKYDFPYMTWLTRLLPFVEQNAI